MQDADLEPEWCCPPLAKADHKAREGTREGICRLHLWGQLQGLIAKGGGTRKSENIGVVNDLSQQSLYQVSGNVLNILYLLFIS